MEKYSILLALVLLWMVAIGSAQSGLYGKIEKEDYLIGKFDATKNPDLFMQITDIKTGYPMWFRRDAYAAFKRMYDDMLAANPTLPKDLTIISALRNVTAQATIWNRKWNGEYSKIENPVVRGLGIMEWSSMPGTSRHHWGTDLDFFSLNNSDFDHGYGKIIYSWFKANAKNYGFCQPYTAGRCAGYNEERWHWSFFPVSSPLLIAWNSLYGTSSICNWASRVSFDGAKSVSVLASAYVNTISSDCL